MKGTVAGIAVGVALGLYIMVLGWMIAGPKFSEVHEHGATCVVSQELVFSSISCHWKRP